MAKKSSEQSRLRRKQKRRLKRVVNKEAVVRRAMGTCPLCRRRPANSVLQNHCEPGKSFRACGRCLEKASRQDHGWYFWAWKAGLMTAAECAALGVDEFGVDDFDSVDDQDDQDGEDDQDDADDDAPEEVSFLDGRVSYGGSGVRELKAAGTRTVTPPAGADGDMGQCQVCCSQPAFTQLQNHPVTGDDYLMCKPCFARFMCQFLISPRGAPAGLAAGERSFLASLNNLPTDVRG